MDSILFEDDSDDLEYFDVLNLLPLSNVRLKIDDFDNESSNNNKNVVRERGALPTLINCSNPRSTIISLSTNKNCTNDINNDRYLKRQTGACITEINDNESKNDFNSLKKSNIDDQSVIDATTTFCELAKDNNKQFSERPCSSNFELLKKKDNQRAKDFFDSRFKAKQQQIDSHHYVLNHKDSSLLQLKEHNRSGFSYKDNSNKAKVVETEETKSLWISDNEETDDMSRRPLVLRVVDSDVTKGKNSNKTSLDPENDKNDDDAIHKENVRENESNFCRTIKPDLINDHIVRTNKQQSSVENVKNFFEKKKNNNVVNNHESDVGFVKNKKNGKSRNNGKVNLGFEARSESSDLGLGSEIGSDVRRLSVEENTNVIDQKRIISFNRPYSDDNDKNVSSLIRSRSCMDSIECQDLEEPEFDHVRYKILKSRVFSKKMFKGDKKDVNYDGLMQYLREYSFQDLLMDNNVVIIEPVRAEIDRKPSFNNNNNNNNTQFKLFSNNGTSNDVSTDKTKDTTDTSKSNEKQEKNHFKKTSRQSSLRKHFFYQPIRVNRELNDEELPDPDTVKNVRMMFEETMKKKLKTEITRDCNARKSVSMKDLRMLDCDTEKTAEASRYL